MTYKEGYFVKVPDHIKLEDIQTAVTHLTEEMNFAMCIRRKAQFQIPTATQWGLEPDLRRTTDLLGKLDEL